MLLRPELIDEPEIRAETRTVERTQFPRLDIVEAGAAETQTQQTRGLGKIDAVNILVEGAFHAVQLQIAVGETGQVFQGKAAF